MPVKAFRVCALLLVVATIVLALPVVGEPGRKYTLDELAFLNGIGGFGDVGTLDTSRRVVSPRNRLGCSLKVVWEDHPRPPPWWSIRMSLPDSDRGCDTFAFDLYVEHAEKASLNVYLFESDDDRWVCWGKRLDDLPFRQWRHVEIPRSGMRMWYLGNHRAEWSRVRGLALEVSGGEAVFYVDAVLLRGPGRRVPVFTAADDGYRPVEGRTATLAIPDAPGVAYFPYGAGRLANERLLDGTPALVPVLKDVGIPISGYSPECPSWIRFFVEHGIRTLHYSALAEGYSRFITRRGGWGVREDGTTPNAAPLSVLHLPAAHAVCLSHPAVREVVEKKVGALVRAGFGAWMLVDYVMPYWGGLWGYAEAARRAYLRDLKGADEGLRFSDGGMGCRTVRFPDYFRMYNGWYPAPGDVGLGTWDDFTPPRPRDAVMDENARRRLEMFMWLRTYEWLKLADFAGRRMQALGGLGLWVVPNPEDSYGSPDYVGLLRCAGVVNLLPEWFGPIGWAAEAGYASLPYLRQQAQKGRSRLSIIQETGAGGHAAPYLDWRIAYAGVYALTAAGRLDDFDNDFIDHVPVAEMSDSVRNPREFVRFRDAVAKALAFRAARADGARRPRAQVLCIMSRPPCLADGSMFFGLDRPCSPALGLARARIVFDLRDDFDLTAADLAPYRLVVYTPRAPRVGDLAMLRKWVEGGKRTLITHSFVPTRRASGFWRLRRSADIGKRDAGCALGLGPIVADSARKVRITAARGAWAGEFRNGEVLELPDGLFRMDAGEAVVRTDAGPLVSEVQVGKGRVSYLHYVPGGSRQVKRIDVRVMRGLARDIGIRPVCEADFPVLTQVFEIEGGRVIMVWDGDAMKRWQWKYQPGIPPMNYEAPGVDDTVRLPADRKGGAIVYDFLEGRVRRLRPMGKFLELSLKDRLCGLFYVLDDSPEGRRRLREIRMRRLDMAGLHFDEVGMDVR